MDATLAELGAAFRRAFESCEATNAALAHVRPLPLSLSTITFTGRLSAASVDLVDVFLGMSIGGGDDDPFVLGDADWGGGPADPPDAAAAAPDRKRKRPKKKFHNQLPLVARTGKAVKLFHNGSIHVTGCACPAEFLDIVVTLCAFLPGVASVPPLRLESFEVQMINANFLLCTAGGAHLVLRPQRLRRELSRLRDLPADFETERHPGVKLVITDGPGGAKVATVMVFQTGSVQISGAKSPAHVATAYAEACRLVDAAVGLLGAEVCRPDPGTVRTTTAKQAFDLVHGYPVTLFHACLG